MWDNPRLLNRAANALIGLASLIFAYAGLQLLLRSPLFPLQEIVVRGELKHADREEIAGALEGMGGNFFAADLAAVRGRLEQVGWVRRVDARRVWPDRIEVRLEEHVAFARWGDSGFVNTYGEPFAAELDAAEQAALPLFAGPLGTEGELARRYRRFTELLAPLGDKPERVVLTPRHAWQLRLVTGLQMELGRDGPEPVEQRLERFVDAFPATLGQLGHTRYERVDLRYPNGFALRVTGWKG
jgi:cell division protein FtsQ